jgi:hypothetical protein
MRENSGSDANANLVASCDASPNIDLAVVPHMKPITGK